MGRLAPAKERAEAFLRDFEWTWTSAVLFCVALVFFIMITMAVIPSFWLYFADQKLKWDGSSGEALKELRDAIAMGLSTGPLITILVASAIMQNWRRKLRGAQSEARPAGGYR
jgi:ABC-type Fe3+ transport system permease subunit